LRVVQLIPLPPCHLLLSKIQNGLPFWCRLTQVVVEKRSLNRCASSSSSSSSSNSNSSSSLFCVCDLCYYSNASVGHRKQISVCISVVCLQCFGTVRLFGIRKSIQPAKYPVMRWRHRYLSKARCKWFAYCPADATATPSFLASLNAEWFNVSGLVPAYPDCTGKEAICLY